MSVRTIDEAIDNTLSAFNKCVNDDPDIKHIINNIAIEFSNIHVVLDTSLLSYYSIRDNISYIYKTIDKAIIVIHYIEQFRIYVSVYRKTHIRSIMLCLNDLNIQYNTICAILSNGNFPFI
jgi:hypothetical protein